MEKLRAEPTLASRLDAQGPSGRWAEVRRLIDTARRDVSELLTTHREQLVR